MRINVLIPFDEQHGGIRIIAGYCNHLAKRGHEVHVLAGQLPRTFLSPWRNFAARVGLRSTESFFQWDRVNRIDIDFDDHSWRSKVPDADALICTWWSLVELAAALPKSHGHLVQLIQHDERVLGWSSDGVMAAWRTPSTRIAVSQWIADVICKETGISDIQVIRNAIDTSFFDSPVRVKNECPTMGYVFSPHFWKGYDLAANVVAKVRSEIRDVQVNCFGSQKPRHNGTALPKGVNFSFRPPQRNLPLLYASCDVWISTSRSEGSCLPPQEAMACRTPAVMTNVGDLGTSDMFKGGGFVVPVEDIDGFVSKTLYVLRSDPKNWAAMSQDAWRAIRMWSWDMATDALENILRNLS
jgi:glycosyltransferase involved in cell wall biosynthesis